MILGLAGNRAVAHHRPRAAPASSGRSRKAWLAITRFVAAAIDQPPHRHVDRDRLEQADPAVIAAAGRSAGSPPTRRRSCPGSKPSRAARPGRGLYRPAAGRAQPPERAAAPAPRGAWRRSGRARPRTPEAARSRRPRRRRGSRRDQLARQRRLDGPFRRSPILDRADPGNCASGRSASPASSVVVLPEPGGPAISTRPVGADKASRRRAADTPRSSPARPMSAPSGRWSESPGPSSAAYIASALCGGRDFAVADSCDGLEVDSHAER